MKISIRVLLMTFVGLSVLTVFLISFVPTIMQSMSSAEEMGDAVLSAANRNARNSITGFAMEMVQLAGNLARMVNPVGFDQQHQKAIFVEVMKEYGPRGLSYLVFATAKEGHFYGLELEPVTGRFDWRVINATVPQRERFVLDENATGYPETVTGDIRIGYDPRKRSWWHKTNHPTVHSTTAYATTSGIKMAAISMGQHIKNPDGTVFGVTTIDVTTITLTEMLKSLKYGKTGQAVLMEVATRAVIGLSSGEDTVLEYVDSNTNSLEVELKLIDNITTPLIAGIRHEIVNDDNVGRSYHHGDNWVSITDIAPVPGLHWRLGIAIPIDDYLGEVRKSRDIVITVAILAVVIVFIFVVVLSYFLGSPLDELGNRMCQTANLDINTKAISPSFISEIFYMQEAYAVMNEQIGRAKAYMPLGLLLGDDDDDDDESEGTNSVMKSRSEKTKGSNQSAKSNRSGHSQSSSHATASVASSYHASPTVMIGVNKASLNPRTVTLLCVNVSRFHDSALGNNLSGDSVSNALTAMTNIVAKNAAENRGMVDNIIGDHFFVSFNATRACAAHSNKGCIAALQIMQDLKHAKLPFHGFTSGLATSDAMVGSIGSDVIRRFTVIGEAYNQAVHLAQCGKYFPPSMRCLATYNSVLDSQETSWSWVGRCAPTRAGSNRYVRVAALQEIRSMDENEWMYQLQEGESKDAFLELNEVFDALFHPKDGTVLPSAAEAKLAQISAKQNVKKGGEGESESEAKNEDTDSSLAAAKTLLEGMINDCKQMDHPERYVSPQLSGKQQQQL